VFTETKYDNLGRVEKTSNPYRAGETNIFWTTPTYDELNRTKFVTTPDGAKVETQYSLATTGNQIGTVVTVIDQANKRRRSITNALGLLTRVDEPDNSNDLGEILAPKQPTLYEYDSLNNLKKVTQGEQVRTFAYDYLSRLKTATNPESGTVNYTYDLIGNLKTKTDARQITTTYDYDKASRIITRSYSDITPQVNYFYDGKGLSQTQTPNYAKGKLTKVVTSATVTNALAETKYTNFDNFGRVLNHQQITDGNTYDTAYAYNLSGALIEETYPSGRKVRNTLAVDGKLLQVQSSKANETLKMYANSFNYNASGAVTSLRLGNGRFENTQFNSRLQPTQIGLGSSAASQNLLKLNFDYGTTAAENNGNVTKQTITVPTIGTNQGFVSTQNYTYDSLNRLKSAEETIPNQVGWKQTFKYDRYGNRTFDTTNNNTTTLLSGCPVNVCNPSANTQNNKLVGTNYDEVGNTKIEASGQSYDYDAENKMVKAKNASGTTLGDYFYDGDGKRIKKIVPNGETTIFVYDASGKMVAEYSTVTASQSEAKINYTTNDHLGSPRINTDTNGNIIARHDLMPFGEEIARASYGSDTVRNKFTTYERDGETDLDFAQARMYLSKLGRFLTQDPSSRSIIKKDPQSWNRYSYCYNRPIILIDSNGRWPTGTHNKLIEFAFKGLSPEQITQIKTGSAKTDSFSDGKPVSTLWPSEAHKHAMTEKGLTVEEAQKKSMDWLNTKLKEVKKIQSEWESNGGKGISGQALWVLGQATHTYEDGTSPAHGYDKVYSIPTKTSTITRPDGTMVEYTETDVATFKKELEDHAKDESMEPTAEQYADSALRSRAFFLIAFGEEKFGQLEMSENERKAVRNLVEETRKKNK
jgi:RHS repeat-associated protein